MAQEREPRLGRGLESLIPRGPNKPAAPSPSEPPAAPTLASSVPGVRDIPLALITPNRSQPRQEFATERLNELVESLRAHGLLQPIVVRPHGEGFELIAGERRFRAAQELGWSTIRASILTLQDQSMLEAALVENIQREDLNPLELARAYREMIDTLHLTQEELARRLGKSRSALANTLRLLDLPDPVKEKVAAGSISMSAARALLALTDPAVQSQAADRVAAGELTVRQLEALAQGRPPVPTREARADDPNLRDLERDLQHDLGTRVELKGTAKAGRLVIAYHSAAQLDWLQRLLRRGRPDPVDGIPDED